MTTTPDETGLAGQTYVEVEGVRIHAEEEKK